MVEASAGTGKTYAIGMLVLRAVVELNIPIDKILVVTFTNAATEELRSRIRARLIEARDLLENPPPKTKIAADETLVSWLSGLEDRRSALSRLHGALYDIDLSAIFTIHGFCQRMLTEQALESGQLFDVELLADIDHVRSQVADDFWRTKVYPLPHPACSLLLSRFSTPERLLASVSLACGHLGRIEPQTGSIKSAAARFQAAKKKLACWWQENCAELHKYFTEGLSRGYFKKDFAASFGTWFSTISAFLGERTAVVPENIQLLDRQLLTEALNGSRLRGPERQQTFLRDWPLSDGEAKEFLTAADNLLLTVRVRLAQLLRHEVGRRLEKQGFMGFDDLILRLSNGLCGDRGRSLKRALGERFTMALIDEFQDTDSAQWFIFSTLFGDDTHYLYLIGDPKQAIYKFRGADIHSYFFARESAVNHLTLANNYRSHPLLVKEINRLFSSRPDPFRFGGDRLRYQPVSAAKTQDDLGLYRDGRDLCGMAYCMLQPDEDVASGRWRSGRAGEAIRRFVVAEIGRLLDTHNPVVINTGGERSLGPADIGILVRSNKQAREYHQALADNCIPAVIGSRESVFLTPQCRELMFVVEAISAPGDLPRLKTALAVSWFGFSGNSLQDLWKDEEQVSRYHSRFLGYSQLWQEQGFLVMMSRLLIEEQVMTTLAPCRGAERAIANINHLLELIQEQEHTENLGRGQLLQWLQKMMQEESGGADAELLLESDEDAVRIVTMHSAKGLEYPVVFCPCLWYASSRVMQEKLQVRCHENPHGQVVDLGSDQFERRRAMAADEEKSEDLRLLYVAMTRAKLRCYTLWTDATSSGAAGDSFDSALGYLLFPGGACDYQAQLDRFKTLAEISPVELIHVPAVDSPRDYLQAVEPTTFHSLPPSDRSLYTDWQMSSFSALAQLSEYGYEAERDAQSVSQTEDIPVSGLPAGPNFGNLIHDLLEGFSFEALGSQPDDERHLLEVQQLCSRYGVTAEPKEVERLLRLVVETPLKTCCSPAEGNFSLSMVPDCDCLKEMAFYYRFRYMATERINDILAGEEAVTPLSNKVMRGYLTGFVDLICRYRNRYYIIDYKTNFLGEKMEDYNRANLVSAMQSHNYGLQYWIYSLVLHRHLTNHLTHYRYQQNFGGVMYLFVRGMRPGIAGSGVYHTIPDYHTLLELDLLIGEGADG